MIAATTLVHGMVVAARNVRDFETTGASLFNPWT
jgi:predicted nucleic acid-binding protein